MRNKENNKWQGLNEDVVVGGSYVYPIGNGEFRTAGGSSDGEKKNKKEKDKKEKEEPKKKEDKKKSVSLSKEREPVWKREGFDSYIDYLQGNKASKKTDNNNRKGAEDEKRNGRRNPRKWKNNPDDKLIKNSDGKPFADQIDEQEGQNCSTVIMEYANNNTGGDKDRHFYEKQAKEKFGRDVSTYALDPRQLFEMVQVNFERSFEHESAMKNGADYKAALDDGYSVMTNLEIYHAEGFDKGTVVTHNVLVVGYTDDNNYIYMDPDTGRLMENGIQNFNKGDWYIYNFVIKGNK